MDRAARLVGVGPMAAVAGSMAQLAAEAGLKAGSPEAIVENGGDIYIQATEPVIIALHTGTAELADRLAFSIEPGDTPISICSSSGKMGHSMSLGDCDLATVVAKDAALADAAATMAANLVKTIGEVDAALERIAGIEGVEGVLIVKDNRIPPEGFTNAAFAAHQCEPVGAEYEDGQHWDTFELALPAGTTRIVARLMYQSVSWPYVKFLLEQNRTDDWGQKLYDLWARTDHCPPSVMAELIQQVNTADGA